MRNTVKNSTMKYTPKTKSVVSQGKTDKGRTWTKFLYEGTDENGRVLKLYMFEDLNPNKEYELEEYHTEKNGKTYQNWRIAKPDPFKLIVDLTKRVENLERGLQMLQDMKKDEKIPPPGRWTNDAPESPVQSEDGLPF